MDESERIEYLCRKEQEEENMRNKEEERKRREEEAAMRAAEEARMQAELLARYMKLSRPRCVHTHVRQSTSKRYNTDRYRSIQLEAYYY